MLRSWLLHTGKQVNKRVNDLRSRRFDVARHRIPALQTMHARESEEFSKEGSTLDGLTGLTGDGPFGLPCGLVPPYVPLSLCPARAF